MGILEDLQKVRKNTSVKQAKQSSLKSARVIVNEQAKPAFDNLPKPSDILLRQKQSSSQVNNLTIDNSPKSIIEANVPFSKSVSPQSIIDANLGKGFLDRNPASGQAKLSISKKSNQVNPILAFTRGLDSLFKGFFR